MTSDNRQSMNSPIMEIDGECYKSYVFVLLKTSFDVHKVYIEFAVFLLSLNVFNYALKYVKNIKSKNRKSKLLSSFFLSELFKAISETIL